MNTLLRFTKVASLATGIIAAGLTGCAETSTAIAAVEVAQVTANVIGSIPGWVQQAADAFQFNNNLNWGKPEKIVVTDTDYVLLYPTSPGQLKASNGVPRMIVIRRSDNQQQL